MTKPEPLDCAWPFAARFTTVTTAGSRSRTTSTMVSEPAGTLTGAAVGSVVGAGERATRSPGARSAMTVAVAPPAMPPRITPTRSNAAPLGPVERGAGAGVGAGYWMAMYPRGYLRGRAAVSA